jgi:putative endopeptidase
MCIDALPARNRRSSSRAATSAAGLVPVLIAAALSWCTSSTAIAQALYDRKAPAHEAGVDASIRPGDDFFAYANGSWLDSTTIPEGKDRWGARNEIDQLSRQRVAKLLDDASAAPAGSTPRKVADFRAAYLDVAGIDARGLSSIKPLLDSIDRIHDRASLTQMLGAGVRADVDPLNWGVYNSSHVLGLSVEESIHGEKSYVPFLVQGGLGLPDREYYSSSGSSMAALRRTYQLHIGQQLALAGFDRVDERAAGIMTLETALAQSHATREVSALDHNADSVWSRAALAREAPGMDWDAFLAAAGLAKQDTFVAWQPGALRGLAALVAAQPIETWKDYLRFHVLERYADVLPHAFAEQVMTLHANPGYGKPPSASRAQRALEATQLAMSDALGKMYTDRYFPAEEKARVRDIVNNVAAAFVRRVAAVTWMSPDTKAIALAKLKKLYVGIGYPDRWEDYSDLAVDPADALGNVRRAEARDYHRALSHLGRPIDSTEWMMAPYTAGALLVFQLNAYDFSAALLQPPKFDPTASDAAAYGAIGAIIGHDVTHYVDVLGADYDVDGAMHHWWAGDDMMRFQAAAEPLERQFSAYRPFADMSVDGRLTRTENVADLGGLVAALDAFHRTLGRKASDKEYVRQQDRAFFLGFAQSWRAKTSDAGLRAQLAGDHAPERYRAATVRNLDAWYDAFDVRPGQALYVEPGARARIW